MGNRTDRAAIGRRLTEKRAELLSEHPFFGRLLLQMGLACAPCGTACTDGERLVFDPEFACRLPDRELKFVMLHEVLHCVLNHVIRGRTLHTLLYNIACDIVVNSLIMQMWGVDHFQVDGQEPMHLAPDGREGYEYGAEEVYQMLLAKNEEELQMILAGKGTGAVDCHDLWDRISDTARFKCVWNGRIQESAKMAGTGTGMPPIIRRLVKDWRLRSETDWRQLLQDFIRYEAFDYTYQPPDRRYAEQDFFLPAFNRDEWNGSAEDLWVCVDTSASVDGQELSEAMAEILDAAAQANLKGAISFFDDQITKPSEFCSVEDLKKIQPFGGGGTNFHMIFRYLREHMMLEPPKGILIFTDGYARCPPEEEALGIPVFWIIPEDGNTGLPWGKVAVVPGHSR